MMGGEYHLKYVEQFPDINKLCNVAFCWIYSEIYLNVKLAVQIPLRICFPETFILSILCGHMTEQFNPLKPELNPICYLLALLGAHHFLHVSRIRVKSLTFRLLMSYIYGAPILDVSRSHTTTQHSR